MTERQKFMAEIERICGGKMPDTYCTTGRCISGWDTAPIMQARHIARLSNASDT